MKKRKKFNINKEFNLSLKYLRESDNYIAITFGVFVFLFAFGMIFPYIVPPEILEIILETVREWVRDLLEKTEGKGFFGMWWFIFQNNVTIAFVSIFSGFLFALVPIFLILSNGFGIGVISSIVYSSSGEGISVFIRLLPHGVFEIPAIIISFALGIKFGSFIFYKNQTETFKKFLINSLRVFIFVIVPLLILAAAIEAFLIIFVS